MLEATRTLIRDRMARLTRAEEKAVKAAASAKRALGRLSHRGEGEDVLGSILRRQETAAVERARACAAERDLHQQALDLSMDYAWRGEPGPEPVWIGIDLAGPEKDRPDLHFDPRRGRR